MVGNRPILESLVVPAFEEAVCAEVEAAENIEILGDSDEVCLRGVLGAGHLVQVIPSEIDRERTQLRFSMIAGVFVGDVATQALLVGNLLESTPFHVQADFLLGNCGQMMVGCDLVVCDDDEPLVRRRLAELLQLANDLEWFFPLRMPSRIRWLESCNMEIPWSELPHGELAEFFDGGMQAPPVERTPVTLLGWRWGSCAGRTCCACCASTPRMVAFRAVCAACGRRREHRIKMGGLKSGWT